MAAPTPVGIARRPWTRDMDPLINELDDGRLVAGVARRDQQALAEIYRRHGDSVFGVDPPGGRRPVPWPRRSPRRSSSACGTSPSATTPTGARCARSSTARATAGPSSGSVPRRPAAAGRIGSTVRRAPLALDVEQQALEGLGSEAVAEALATLGEGERQAIVLAYFGGHSYREVAVRLDLPEGTVKSRIRLGLAKLADRLEASGLGTHP